MTPICTNGNLASMRVRDIINSDGSWNSELIHNIFLPDDAKSILSVPYGVPGERMRSFGVSTQMAISLLKVRTS